MVVVGEAGERKIASDRLAPVLLGDDVVDLEGEFVADLRHPAVFTTLASALPNELGKGGVHGRSSAAFGTPEYLPSFRLESGKNRANAFEVVHLRVFFGDERPGAGLGREFVHPADVVLGERKSEDGACHARRHRCIGVKDAQPHFHFSLRCERRSLHGKYSTAAWRTRPSEW